MFQRKLLEILQTVFQKHLLEVIKNQQVFTDIIYKFIFTMFLFVLQNVNLSFPARNTNVSAIIICSSIVERKIDAADRKLRKNSGKNYKKTKYIMGGNVNVLKY